MTTAMEVPTMDDEVHVSTHGDVTVVAMSGEIGVEKTESLRAVLARIADENRSDVVLDFTRVTFVDATGVSALVHAHKRLRLAGRTMDVVVDDERAMRSLRITGLSRLFVVHRSVEDALSSRH